MTKTPGMHYLVFLFLAMPVLPAASHETPAVHACDKPELPSQSATMMEQEIFQSRLAIFEQCMFEFIRGQQNQAGIHEQSAQTALEEWTEYYQSLR